MKSHISSCARVLAAVLLASVQLVSKDKRTNQPQTLPQAIASIRNAIVQIDIVSPDIPSMELPLGTGFLVSREGYVITAAHVIKAGTEALERIKSDHKHLAVGMPYDFNEDGHFVLYPGTFTFQAFETIELDERADIALLKLVKNPFDSGFSLGTVDGRSVPVRFGTVSVSSGEPVEGTAIGVSGYPFGNPTLVTNSGIVASAGYNLRGGPPDSPDHSGNVYLFDAAANPGNSGGPVYIASSGVVLGLCKGFINDPVTDQFGTPVQLPTGQVLSYSSRLTVIIPARYISVLLRKHNVSFSSMAP
jgi:S1-C subfamily serine protease